jgi:hypothetical protein
VNHPSTFKRATNSPPTLLPSSFGPQRLVFSFLFSALIDIIRGALPRLSRTQRSPCRNTSATSFDLKHDGLSLDEQRTDQSHPPSDNLSRGCHSTTPADSFCTRLSTLSSFKLFWFCTRLRALRAEGFNTKLSRTLHFTVTTGYVLA